MDQDYLFLKDWAILLGMAAVKSPDFDSSRQVVGFLHLGLGGEEGRDRGEGDARKDAPGASGGDEIR